MDFRKITLTFFGLLLSVAVVVAQSGSCPAYVEATMESVLETCEDLGRDEACFGNVDLEATSSFSTFNFAQPGDIENINSIRTLTLSSMSITDNTWGIAMVQVRASLPDSSSENVTIALFGNVNITNAVDPEVNITGTVASPSIIRLRPDPEGTQLAGAETGTELTVIGRLDTSQWVQIEMPDGSGAVGWIYAPVLNLDGDIESLPVADANAQHFGPLQAFYLETGQDDRPCEEAPDSGILIQTPEGEGRVNFMINEVAISLGSTSYMRVQDDTMEIFMLEGRGTATVDGVTSSIPAGTFVSIPVAIGEEDIELNVPAGIPGRPQPYDLEEIQFVLIDLLPEEIEIAEPLTQEEIDALIGGGGTGAASLIAGVDCSSFALISPLTNVSDRSNTFVWSEAPGATDYELVFYDFAGGVASPTFFTTGTSLTVNMGQVSTGSELQWEVRAFKDGEYACVTGRSAQILRTQGANIWWVCEGSGVRIHWEVSYSVFSASYFWTDNSTSVSINHGPLGGVSTASVFYDGHSGLQQGLNVTLFSGGSVGIRSYAVGEVLNC